MGPCKYPRPCVCRALYTNGPCLSVLPKDWLGYISLSDYVGLSLTMLLIENNGIILKDLNNKGNL